MSAEPLTREERERLIAGAPVRLPVIVRDRYEATVQAEEAGRKAAEERAERAEGCMRLAAEDLVLAIIYATDGDCGTSVAEWSDSVRTMVVCLSRLERHGVEIPPAPSKWVAAYRALADDDAARGGG